MLRDKQALIDISTAIQQTLLYVQGIDQNNLQEDDEKQAAILYRLIIIGEATKHEKIKTHHGHNRSRSCSTSKDFEGLHRRRTRLHHQLLLQIPQGM
jgi:uncharacterized protein with HEPN domain